MSLLIWTTKDLQDIIDLAYKDERVNGLEFRITGSWIPVMLLFRIGFN